MNICTGGKVTSLAEVWIETCGSGYLVGKKESLPLRKCGLKLDKLQAGLISTESLPLRKCGLKLAMVQTLMLRPLVTSLAEVWIETRNIASMSKATVGHFPCGSVD